MDACALLCPTPPTPRVATHLVGVLGGMGPAAGADFVVKFVQACAGLMAERGIAVTDQHFPEHWLVQVPVPDRTLGLLHPASAAAQPVHAMLQAVARLSALGVRSIAIACNTAHAWHAQIQEQFPHLDVLHVAEEVVAHLQSAGVATTGLLATRGTYLAGIYESWLGQADLRWHLPTDVERDKLMAGIYDGVKASRMEFARAQFQEVVDSITRRHELQSLILGCTEIPLALQGTPSQPGLLLVDPAEVLARALARRAYDGPRPTQARPSHHSGQPTLHLIPQT